MEYALLIFILVMAAGGIVYKALEARKHQATSALHTEAREYQPGDLVITNILPLTSNYRQGLIARLKTGDDLMIVREKENATDANAVQVIFSGHETDLRDTVIGHLEPDLAAKIAPILDEYAVGAQRFVHAQVVALNKTEPHASVQIKFRLPTAEDLKHHRDKRSIEQFL